MKKLRSLATVLVFVSLVSVAFAKTWFEQATENLNEYRAAEEAYDQRDAEIAQEKADLDAAILDAQFRVSNLPPCVDPADVILLNAYLANAESYSDDAADDISGAHFDHEFADDYYDKGLRHYIDEEYQDAASDFSSAVFWLDEADSEFDAAASDLAAGQAEVDAANALMDEVETCDPMMP